MEELKAYYKEQHQNQPQPNLTVGPVAGRKPRRTQKGLLIAASAVVALAVTVAAVPSVRAEVMKLTKSFTDMLTGEVHEVEMPPDFAVTEDPLVEILSKYRRLTYDEYTSETFKLNINTMTIELKDGDGKPLYSSVVEDHGGELSGYSEKPFWEKLESYGFPTISSWAVRIWNFRGSILYPVKDAPPINIWEDGDYIIKEYEADTEKIATCIFSANVEGGMFEASIGVTGDSSINHWAGAYYYSGEDAEFVDVEGWEQAVFANEPSWSTYEGDVTHFTIPTLRLLKANTGSNAEANPFIVCMVRSKTLTLEELIAIAESIR